MNTHCGGPVCKTQLSANDSCICVIPAIIANGLAPDHHIASAGIVALDQGYRGCEQGTLTDPPIRQRRWASVNAAT